MCILYQFICLFLSAFVGFCLFVSLLDCRHICIFLLSIFCVLFCFYLFVFYFVCLFINFFVCLPASQIQSTFCHSSKANIDFFGQYLSSSFFVCSFFSCSEQLNCWPCHWLTDSPTEGNFTSDIQRATLAGDLWPLRHLIRVMRRDMTWPKFWLFRQF